MSVKTEAYVAIEETLAARLRQSWGSIVTRLRPRLEAAAARGDWQQVRALAATIDVDTIMKECEGAIRYSTYAALLFGASRLTDNVKTTWIGQGGAEEVVEKSVNALKQAIESNVKAQIELALLAEIERLVEQPIEKADKAKSLYVRRDLLNHEEFTAWAKAQGFDTTLGDHAHVTIAYSKKPVDWGKFKPEAGELTETQGKREVHPLGDGGAIVLRFDGPDLATRWQELCDGGCSWDYDGYKPHVTITWKKPDDLDLSKVKPYTGKLVFGPEVFEELDEDWKDGVVEKVQKANPYHDELGRFTHAEYATHISTGPAFKHMHNNAKYVYMRAVQIASQSLRQAMVQDLFDAYVAEISRNPNYTKEEVEYIRVAPMDNLDVWKPFVEEKLGVKLDIRSSKQRNYSFDNYEFYVDQLKWGTEQEKVMFLNSVANAMGISPQAVDMTLKTTKDQFELNGRMLDYGGYYRRAPKGGGKAEIALYSALKGETSALTVLLHEHGHHKFAQAEKDVMSKVSDMVAGRRQTHPQEKDNAFGLHLAKSGRKVSNYANDWWEAYERTVKTDGTSDYNVFRSAVNETLAEVNAMTPAQRAKVAPEWKELYGVVQTGYQEIVDSGYPI